MLSKNISTISKISLDKSLNFVYTLGRFHGKETCENEHWIQGFRA
jgi:hypothetical protein